MKNEIFIDVIIERLLIFISLRVCLQNVFLLNLVVVEVCLGKSLVGLNGRDSFVDRGVRSAARATAISTFILLLVITSQGDATSVVLRLSTLRTVVHCGRLGLLLLGSGVCRSFSNDLLRDVHK